MEKLLIEIGKYTESKYDISFQFWGADLNHCYLRSKGSDIDLFNTNQHETPEECVYAVLEWIYRVNRVKLVDRVHYEHPAHMLTELGHAPFQENRVFKCLTDEYGAFEKDREYHAYDIGKFGRRTALDWSVVYPYQWQQVYNHIKP